MEAELQQLGELITALHASVLEALQRKYSSVLSSDDHTHGLATRVLHQFNIIRPRFYKLEKVGIGGQRLEVNLDLIMLVYSLPLPFEVLLIF